MDGARILLPRGIEGPKVRAWEDGDGRKRAFYDAFPFMPLVLRIGDGLNLHTNVLEGGKKHRNVDRVKVQSRVKRILSFFSICASKSLKDLDRLFPLRDFSSTSSTPSSSERPSVLALCYTD